MIYFLQESANNLIKIGFTDRENVEDRMREIDRVVHGELTVLATTDGDRSSEAKLHQLFTKHRVFGEWFKPCPELINLIISIKEDYGRQLLKTAMDMAPEVFKAKTFTTTGKRVLWIRDEEHILICPICRDEHVHLDNISTDFESKSDKVLTVFCSCECSHNWKLCISFHEGNTFVESFAVDGDNPILIQSMKMK